MKYIITSILFVFLLSACSTEKAGHPPTQDILIALENEQRDLIVEYYDCISYYTPAEGRCNYPEVDFLECLWTIGIEEENEYIKCWFETEAY